ncbi:MAG TPA: lysophospholipid acyltransferase family protein [Vicinamibacterales bacterium]|jgi:KDO2-lipid IV(A) lauroyltransferase
MSAPRGRLEYLMGTAVIRGVGWLPWILVDGLGAAAGAIVYALDGRHRRIALENVAAALPGYAPREQRAVVRGAFRHFGTFLFELMKFSTLSPEQMAARVTIEGEAHIEQAYARGRGVLLTGGHFGCWEIQALAHAAQLRPMGMLARPLQRPGLNRLLERLRGRTGNFVIDRRGTLRRVLRALQDGHAVAILIDQHVHEHDAIPVAFFGRPAATTSMLAALALRTGAAVLPLFAIPLGRGRYHLVYEPAIEPSTDAADPTRDLTERCTAALERRVREHPHLWLWMHQRWR